METIQNLTECEAIAKARALIKTFTRVRGEKEWTYSLMTKKDSEDFIWNYLYDNKLQWVNPIKYGNNNMVVVCHQDF